MKNYTLLLALGLFALTTLNPAVVSAMTISNETLPEQDSLASPVYLSPTVEGNDVILSWGADGPEGAWKNYDNGSPLSALGLSQPGTFRMAARYTAETLIENVNKPVTKFAFFPTGLFTQYTIKIWKGESAEMLVYNQPLNGLQINMWNEIILLDEVVIESDAEYWFGLELYQMKDFEFPAAFDSGPAISGFGDMVNLGGDWIPISNYGFDNNWSLRVFISDQELTKGVSSATVAEISLMHSGSSLIKGQLAELSSSSKPAKNTQNTLGYNIYRDGVKLNAGPVNTAVFTDTNLNTGTYLYGVTALYDGGESVPVERVFQVGAPELVLSPAFISDTIPAGQTITKQLSLANPGVSQLEWELNALPIYFTFSAINGVIAGGGSQTLELTINPSGMVNGANLFAIEFMTNNQNNPVTFLILSITTDGEVVAIWDPEYLDFGMVPVFQTSLQSVSLTNLTQATLYLFTFTTSTGSFAAYPPTWDVPAGGTIDIPVSFTPDGVGTFSDILEVEYFNYLGSAILSLPLSGEGMILPPSGLSAELGDEAVTLKWLPPGSSPDILRFGSGEPFSAIGTSGPGEFEFAHRFTPVDLAPYAGKKLDKVGFYIQSTAATFTLKVYTDETGETPIISLPVSNLTANAWNDIALPVSIPLDQTEFLWIGYAISLTVLEFIAAVDGGPAVTGSGDMLKIGETDWTTLTASGLSYNWNIRGLLSDNMDNVSLLSGRQGSITDSISLTGYNVYRDGELLTGSPITETTYTTPILPGETFLYEVTSVFPYGESLPSGMVVAMPLPLLLPPGWEFEISPFVHNIHIPVEVALIGIQPVPGDIVGVFYDDNGTYKCAGAVIWDGEHQTLTAYGNDPATLQKEGFDVHEAITWKLYQSGNGNTIWAIATYNQSMPHHNGTFMMMGLSMLDSVETGTLGISGVISGTIAVFPNPSEGDINVSGVTPGDRISVYDQAGKMIADFITDKNSILLRLPQAGFYIIEVRGVNQTFRAKALVR